MGSTLFRRTEPPIESMPIHWALGRGADRIHTSRPFEYTRADRARAASTSGTGADEVEAASASGGGSGAAGRGAGALVGEGSATATPALAAASAREPASCRDGVHPSQRAPRATNHERPDIGTRP